MAEENFTTYRSWLAECGRLQEYLDSPINGKAAEFVNSIVAALKHSGKEFDFGTVRNLIGEGRFNEVLDLYRGNEGADTKVFDDLIWLVETDTLYVQTFFSGPFLDEAVVVKEEDGCISVRGLSIDSNKPVTNVNRI